MPERFATEEAQKEAQFLQKAAAERSRKGHSKDSNAAEFDFLSEKLDLVRKDDPLLYGQALQLPELSKEVENALPASSRDTFR